MFAAGKGMQLLIGKLVASLLGKLSHLLGSLAGLDLLHHIRRQILNAHCFPFLTYGHRSIVREQLSCT